MVICRKCTKNPKLSNFFLRIFVSDSLRNDGDVISVLQK